MSLLPVDQLLAPLGDDAPCGPDLEYDPAFMALEEAARGKPEQQFGDTVIAAEEPDWRVVFENARELAERTRDLRVAVLLARSAARLHGLAGYADGLALIAGLLEQQWDHVHPMLDVDDGNDPTMRLNALGPLVDGATGLADLRAATVIGGRIGLTVRQLELAAGKAEPHGDESAPSPAGVQDALAAGVAQDGDLLARMKRPSADLLRIDTLLTDKVGSQGPELKPLQLLTRWVAAAAEEAASAGGAPAADTADSGSEAGPAAVGVSAPGSLRSREDVVRTLDRVCDWIEKNEPTNPAPLLIRRAQRLMSKNFLDIIRDLAPDGLAQIENLAGRTDE